MSNEPSLASVIMIITCLHNVRSWIAASAKITLSLRLDRMNVADLENWIPAILGKFRI